MELYLRYSPILQLIVKDYNEVSSKTREETLEYLAVDDPASKTIQHAFNAFREACMVYPVTEDNFLSGERIPIIEAQETHEILAFQLFSGMYKISFQLLRELLELVLLQFYIHLRSDEAFMRNWLKGDKDTPRKDEFKKIIGRSEFYKLANHSLNLDSQLDRLYGSLSEYTHTQGFGRSHQALKTENRPVFSKFALQAFSKIYFDTIKYCVSLIAIHFPNAIIPLPAFEKFGYGGPISFIAQDKVEMIRPIFSGPELSIMELLASKNEVFQELKLRVEAMPDLTRAEIDQTWKAIESNMKYPKSASQ
jgi:hypothetical protein